MDAELAALALSGATTLVTLMATDAWTGAKRSFTALVTRFRPEEQEVIDGQLEHSRSELTVTSVEDQEQVEAELITEWQGRIRRFLAANPDAVQPLREVLDDLSRTSGSSVNTVRTISIKGEATQGGRVYQQGQGTQINR